MNVANLSGPLKSIRSILETPILDERKWAKVAQLPADAVMLDIEDSVPPDRKVEAREKVVRCLAEPSIVGDALPLPRVNDLKSPWGEEDLIAVAHSGAPVIAYPKVRTANELSRVREILDRAGSTAALLLVVETARAVLELERLARVDGVSGLILGPADLALDAGFDHFVGPDVNWDAYAAIRSRLVLVAASYRMVAFDTLITRDLRSEKQAVLHARRARRDGFTGLLTFYPPHLTTINAVYTTTPAELEEAELVVRAYEAARRAGAASVVHAGRALLVHDYERALRTLRAHAGRRGAEI